MKRLIQSLFYAVGLEVKIRRNIKVPEKVSPMIMGLQRFSSLGLPITTIIDVGAAAGTWSMAASRIWTNAMYLLFEPLVERKQILERLVDLHPNFIFMPLAAGNKKSSVNFIIADDLDGSGIAPNSLDPSFTRSVPVVRLDDVVNDVGLKGPFIVKLDTHGFEVPILEGCSGILDNVSLFIIECYGFQIVDNSLLFWEMCQYMNQLGFRLFDLVDVVHRPRDSAFWQCDAFFIKVNNPIFNYNKYK